MIVLSGDRDAGAEEKFLFLEHLHREQRALENACSASTICGRQLSFETDDGNHVEVLFEELGVKCADECAIGEDGEDDVLNGGGTFQQVASGQGFTSGKETETDT